MTDRLRPGVLFDVDGTLADTNYLHTVAWSRALHDAGEWAPMNAIHRLIGMGGDQLVPTLLGHQSPAASEARPSRYKELMVDARIYPGARDLLWRIHNEGIAVVVATSAPNEELGPLLELLDADDAIDAATTADDVLSSKPEPEVFLKAMAVGAVDPERALALGDSLGHSGGSSHGHRVYRRRIRWVQPTRARRGGRGACLPRCSRGTGSVPDGTTPEPALLNN